MVRQKQQQHIIFHLIYESQAVRITLFLSSKNGINDHRLAFKREAQEESHLGGVRKQNGDQIPDDKFSLI